ncbi:hypothetical protein BDA99DRAFT_507110 [Phascolomyces articulosus]|uniref:Uncharacterized protein n=1 Tax=Phascolomyces articulosus TaxID=60185 RepID=A0AAD5PEF6_9FUNG|nr:hypothetical protein BDA99DRAFT_507110 [Phascolomyces articulosus]
MDFVKRQTLNLTVLERHDSSIVDICDQSPHAVVYKFIRDKNSWDKMGVEGVLFLVKRKTAPTYALFILNRLSMDNFCLYLSDIRDLSLADEFLICQTSEGQACGLWLFEEKDRQRFLDRILELRKTMESNSVPPQMQVPTATAPSSGGQVNILQLFEKASITPQQQQPVSREQQQQTNHATDLLSMLQSGQQQKGPEQPQPPQMQMPQPHHHQLPHPPPPPPPSSAAAFFNGYNSFPGSEVFPDNGFPNRTPQIPPPPQMFNPQQQSSPMQYPSQSLPPPPPPPSAGPAAAAVIGGNGELNKTYYPTFPPPPPSHHPAATASPQKAASLLQALQGGGPTGQQPPQPPTQPPPGIRQSPQLADQHNHPWSSPNGMNPSPRLAGGPLNPAGQQQQPLPHQSHPHPPPPLMHQSTLDMTQAEVDQRFGSDGRPLLSKPEFIQQFLNMVQNDSSFLDTLYDRYRGKHGQQSASTFVNAIKTMPPYQQM